MLVCFVLGRFYDSNINLQNADVINLTYSDVQCPDAGCGGPQSRPGTRLW